MHVMLPFAEALHATCYGHSDATVLATNDVFGVKKLTAALINKMLQHAAAIDASIAAAGGTATARAAASRLVGIFINCGAPVDATGDDYSRREEEAEAEALASSLPSARARPVSSAAVFGGESGELRGAPARVVRSGSDDKMIMSVTSTTASDDKETKEAAQVRGTLAADTVDAIAAAVAAGVWVPVEIVIARPFIQHLMLSAVVAVAGSKTGATLFGPADSAPPASMHCTHTHTPRPHSTLTIGRCCAVQLSANTSVKTIEGASRALSHTRTPLSLAPSLSVERANRGAQATTRAIFITRTHKH